MAPRILLSSTLRWPIAARLAIAFNKLGCLVDALCPAHHVLPRTSAVRKVYDYATLRPLASLRAAIRAAHADLIIPCDDCAAVDMHRLFKISSTTNTLEREQRSLIERSLGSPEACSLATARAPLLRWADQAGVRTPKTSVINSVQELTAWMARRGFPAVIKTDNSWGGQGVSIVGNGETAVQAYQSSASRQSLPHALWRTLVERDLSIVATRLRQPQALITVQDYIPGRPANRAVVCWQGEVLAGLSVEAIHTMHATGPATVVRIIKNAEMATAAETLVRGLGLSGFWGLDFVLEANTSAAYFIEMNPRATPICHLSLGAGQDLPAALFARLTNMHSTISPPSITEQDVISLFPGEWQRNPSSIYLRSAYHDVPWEEPELVRDGLTVPWSERGLLARGLVRLRAKTKPAPLSPRAPARTALRTSSNK